MARNKKTTINSKVRVIEHILVLILKYVKYICNSVAVVYTSCRTNDKNIILNFDRQKLPQIL